MTMTTTRSRSVLGCLHLVPLLCWLGWVSGQGGQSLSDRPSLVNILLGGGTSPSPLTDPTAPRAGLLGQEGLNLGSTGTGTGTGTTGPRDICSRREYDALFSNCLMNFGYQHLPLFPFLRLRRKCMTGAFRCRSVTTVITCINAQPVNVISNKCWPNVHLLFTKAFKTYGIPCTYEDLYKKCVGMSPEILTIGQRPQKRGRQVSNNPMIRILLQLHMQGNLGHALGM